MKQFNKIKFAKRQIFKTVSFSFLLLVSVSNPLAAQQVSMFDGERDKKPSLRECMKAAEKGNVLRVNNADDTVTLAYASKIYFIKALFGRMVCYSFKPTHQIN
jgi:hypothetical protein